MAPHRNLAARKPNLGRQKIEIKRVEENAKRFVTFSKRKQGIMNKASELSVLSKAQSAIIVFSQNDKLYCFGNPNPDSVIRRYLSAGSSLSNSDDHARRSTREQTSEAKLSQQHEIARNHLEEEKKRLATIMASRVEGSSGAFWWNYPIQEMPLEDLEPFAHSIQGLKQNVTARAHDLMMTVGLTLPPPPPPRFSYLSLLNGDVLEDQAWGWDLGM